MSRHRRTLKGALATAALALALTPAIGSAATLAPLTGTGQPDAIPGRYIVVMNAAASADSKDRLKSSARAGGASIKHDYHAALRGFAAQLSPAALADVRRDPNVDHVEADATMSVASTQTQPEWGLDRIDQIDLPLDQRYRYVPDGTSVQAYVIDSGMNRAHSTFRGRATRSGPDYIANDADASDTCNGHGTHVAGTIGGTTPGVAKKVVFVPVRVMGCDGTGRVSDVIAGVDWVTMDHVSLPSVANLSFGGSDSIALYLAVENSIADGVTYVVAAGNEGAPACNYTPARIAGAITVSSTNSADARPSGANYGECVDVFAPGVNIQSAWIGSDAATRTLSGTSMASAHVAGVVATYLQTHPQATPSQVQLAVTDNATRDKVSNPGPGTPNRLLFSRLGSQIAIVRATSSSPNGLYMAGWAGSLDQGFAMAPGTSPSITALSHDTYQMAFQAANGRIWTTGTSGSHDLGFDMMAGTSPSIAALPGGGYQVAFQAKTGELWTSGPAGQGSLGLEMMAGTSPSITALPGGGYEVAYQNVKGDLATAGAAGTASLGIPMAPGTSPSITAMPGGAYQVAFQYGKGVLCTTSPSGMSCPGQSGGMMPGTSPSITTLPGGGYEVAFHADNGTLWVTGSAGTRQGPPMKAGTSPAITTLPSGRYEVAYQATNGMLSSLSAGGDVYSWGRFMNSATSPSLAGL